MEDFGTSLTFARDKQPDAELRNCWPLEDGFVWSAGRWCEIVFPFAEDGAADGVDTGEIILDMDVFKAPPDLEGQNVFFYLNGLRVGSRMITKRSTVFLDVPATALKAKDNLLAIDTPDASKPSRFSGKDDRILGIQLFSLQARKLANA